MKVFLALMCLALVTVGGCKSGKELPKVDGIKWKLVELNGKEVVLSNPESEIFMFFDSADKKVNRRAACNRFFGNYEMEGEKLTFSSMGATRMACPADSEWEDEFFEMLEVVDAYAVEEGRFTFLSKEEPVAVLQAVEQDMHTPKQ